MNSRMRAVSGWAAALLLSALGWGPGASGQSIAAGQLDPARDPAALHSLHHAPLPEEYVWTAHDAAATLPNHAQFTFRDRERKTELHMFRGSFTFAQRPAVSTLYIAGPRSVKAFLNGTAVMEQAADAQSPLNTHVFRADVSAALRIGTNVLAIEAVRGRGIVAASDSPVVQQMAYGETLVAKIVPAAPGVEAASLSMTTAAWRSVAASAPGWQAAEFDDRAWPRVAALGAIESKAEFFQWNTDAGMYDWPGYRGMSPNLRSYSLRAMQVTHRFDGAGTLDHVDALTQATPREPFSVRPPAGTAAAGNAPALLLDFGREVAGRLLIKSGCDCEAQVVVSYGESESEALTGGHYLGTNLLRLPPHGEARGPKSGFRYAWLRFVGAAVVTAFRSIELEGIAYPVNYTGSFASSDALLNRIWETSAHTAHLCMQDGIWDAPKRDRGWWVGDLDASGPVIADIFGDSALLNETLTRLIPPSGQDVNGIPGYTALWVTTLAELYRRSGDRSLLEARHAELVKLLEKMDGELDASGRFANKDHRWLFVDWSPGLFAFTDEAREGTQLEFVRALRAGAWLLDELGDSAAAAHYTERAGALAAEMRSRFAGTDGVFGERWQLNAMAVLAGVAQERDYDAIWTRVLGAVGQRDAQAQTISPYFNGYLLQAMARMGRRREALDWMRVYWGGMLAEGATSFWEAYDLRWPKQDPHVGLQADGTSGYFVSLAHGWSSGPAAWLMEEVLGIHAESAGYRKVVIRPDLLGLEWARGQVASPRGAIGVEMRKKPEAAIEVTLPAGVEATVLVPLAHADAHVLVDGAPVAATPAEQGERAAIVLRTAGRYEITSR